MSTSLYNIQKEYLSIAEKLMDGEVTEQIEQALAINQQQLQEKGINYGLVIKQMEAETDIIDSEIKRLQNLKLIRNNAIDRLKDGISKAMQVYGIEKIESPLIKISFRNSKSVEVDDIDKLDDKYVTKKLTVTPDKPAIKKAIESGEIINGANLINNKNLKIR